VAGTAPLSFQWYLNGTIPIANGTQRTLVLTNVQFADSGNYTVSVFNSLGSVLSQPATLRVLVPPDLLSFTLTGNVAGFTISSLPGLLYTVSYADVPTSSTWTQLPKGFQRLGTGQPLSFQDPRASTSQRYYRIQVE
jgi:hypothetical protein